MENNTMNNNAQNQTEPNTNTQPGANGNAQGKMFTQDDVNRIVSERLKEERQRATEPNPLDEREIELSKRENKLACREFLTENEYIPELLEILDTSDKKKFEETVSKLHEVIPQISKKTAATVPTVVGGTPGSGSPTRDDLIANAFKPKI